MVKRVRAWVCKDCGLLKVILTSCQECHTFFLSLPSYPAGGRGIAGAAMREAGGGRGAGMSQVPRLLDRGRAPPPSGPWDSCRCTHPPGPFRWKIPVLLPRLRTPAGSEMGTQDGAPRPGLALASAGTRTLVSPHFPRERCCGQGLGGSSLDPRMTTCPACARARPTLRRSAKSGAGRGGAGGNSRGIGRPGCQGNTCWLWSLDGVCSRPWAGGSFR